MSDLYFLGYFADRVVLGEQRGRVAAGEPILLRLSVAGVRVELLPAAGRVELRRGRADARRLVRPQRRLRRRLAVRSAYGEQFSPSAASGRPAIDHRHGPLFVMRLVFCCLFQQALRSAHEARPDGDVVPRRVPDRLPNFRVVRVGRGRVRTLRTPFR